MKRERGGGRERGGMERGRMEGGREREGWRERGGKTLLINFCRLYKAYKAFYWLFISSGILIQFPKLHIVSVSRKGCNICTHFYQHAIAGSLHQGCVAYLTLAIPATWMLHCSVWAVLFHLESTSYIVSQITVQTFSIVRGIYTALYCHWQGSTIAKQPIVGRHMNWSFSDMSLCRQGVEHRMRGVA